MNAFKTFTPPESSNPQDWRESLQAHASSLHGAAPEFVQQEVRTVLDRVQAAVQNGQIRFQGTVKESVDFANAVLDSVHAVDATVTAWNCPQLCSPSTALFVQPDEDDRFSFQPMFTL